MLPSDFHLEARYYYSLLCQEEKQIYEFIVELLLKQQYRFRYTAFPEIVPDDKDIAALPMFVYDFNGTSNIFKVYDAILWDCPEFYYVASSSLEFVIDHMGYYQIGKDTPEYTSEEIADINKELDRIYHKFDDITDDFELEVQVHDYILKYYDYENEDDKLFGRTKDEIFTVVGMLKTGEAVCAGFSRMAQYIFQRRGIPTVNVIAMAGEDDDKELHSWLAVKIKGNYYHLDITFDESNSTDKEIAPYIYFNLTDDEIREDHEFSYESYPNIVCDSSKCNYYNHRGLFFDTKEEVAQGVNKFINENKNIGGVQYFYFKSPFLDEKEVKAGLLSGTSRELVRDATYIRCAGHYTVILTLKSDDKNEVK